MSDQRKGDWILTYTGRKFYPLDPRAEDVVLEDVAHALSNLCRFGGHTLRYYSVAEHSVLVSRVVPPEYALLGLLHDAPEAYLMDLPRPLKRMMPAYGEAENVVWKAVAERFGLGLNLGLIAALKRADDDVLALEAVHLMRTPELITGWMADRENYVLDRHPDVLPKGLSPGMAERLFLDRYLELVGTRHAA